MSEAYEADIERPQSVGDSEMWTLASWRRRAAAWLLDAMGFNLPLASLLMAVFMLGIGLPGQGSPIFWAVAMVSLGLFFGYVAWWLLSLRTGQTPGKHLMHLTVLRDSGSGCGWGYMFVREFVIKAVVIGMVGNLTLGFGWLLNYLWPLWDGEGNRQALHDKLIGTIVVHSR